MPGRVYGFAGMFPVLRSAPSAPLRGSRMPKPRARSAASARPAAPYHHGDLRRALIDTALAMVTEEGAWNFTLREVARRAGVSQAAPYNHFEDRSEERRVGKEGRCPGWQVRSTNKRR